MDYQRRWLEERGSDDSHGRALWALGTVLNRSNTAPLHDMAGRIFEQSLLEHPGHFQPTRLGLRTVLEFTNTCSASPVTAAPGRYRRNWLQDCLRSTGNN